MSSNNVAVIGLGKIGLPLAVQYAKKGKQVIGVDTNQDLVAKINQGIEPFPGEKNLQNFLREVLLDKKLTATNDYEEALKFAEIVVIATPLFIDDQNKPDFNILDTVSSSIGRHIRKDTLIILETTVPIGTTRGRFANTIEKYSALEAGKDFFVAFSPERVFTGRVFEDLRKYPKLVGGINDESSLRARKFYEEVLDFNERADLNRKNGVWLMQSAEAAEFAKLAETTYRDVNIALANQFAKHASKRGLSITEIVEASNSQPFSHIHSPGIWVGGHCIPVYPHLYLFGDPDASIVSLARTVNAGTAHLAVEGISKVLGNLKNLNALVLGVSYRPGVKESSFSGAFALNYELTIRGVKAFFRDPFYEREELISLGLRPYNESEEFEIIILHTAHEEFRNIAGELRVLPQVVLDGRNFFTKDQWTSVNYISL